MKEKRILLGITGVLLIGYVILSAALTPPKNAVETAENESQTASSAVYTARETDGKIAVYAGDALLLETDTRVADLPKIDRIRLRDGIGLYSEEELKRFIEDYCS